MKTPTVLLILEELEDIEIYGTFLRDRGYQTLSFPSPSEGIIALETKSVSLVIVSQGTPAFEGRQALEKSQKLQPEVPVLVVTRVFDLQCYLEAMYLGAFDYLERPTPRDLVGAVDALIFRGAII